VDDTADDVNSSSNTVESELLVGSKKRNNNNLAENNLVCVSDRHFVQMHRNGEFSSLPCYNFYKNEVTEDKKRKYALND
jgi:hypothetical protein